MKRTKYHTVGTVPEFTGKIIKRGKTDTPNIQIQMYMYFRGCVGSSWSCSYGSWIYNYLRNQSLSPLKL